MDQPGIGTFCGPGRQALGRRVRASIVRQRPSEKYQTVSIASRLLSLILISTAIDRRLGSSKMSTQECIRLAQSLPPRLLHFFTRFPPRIIAKPEAAALTTATATSNTTPSSTPLAEDQSITSSATPSLQPNAQNPFLASRNPHTQKTSPPPYSLRRQAELYKIAHAHGVASLLPFSHKDPDVKLKRRTEGGLQVKGTGVGQRVKGKKWERAMKGKLERRREAMLRMPSLVKAWKKVRFQSLQFLASPVMEDLRLERFFRLEIIG